MNDISSTEETSKLDKSPSNAQALKNIQLISTPLEVDQRLKSPLKLWEPNTNHCETWTGPGYICHGCCLVDCSRRHVPVRARKDPAEILDIAGIPIRHIARETGTILEQGPHRGDLRGIPTGNVPVKGIGLFEHTAEIRGALQLPGGQVLVE
jgi:hypothetical protein